MTVAQTLLGQDCAVTWMRVHSGHWTVGFQGQSVFFTSTTNDRWSRRGEAQTVTSRCLPSPCPVVGAVLERRRRKGQRGSVLTELAVWGSALSNGHMVTLRRVPAQLFGGWP